MQESLLFKQFSVLFQKPHAVFKLFSECFVGQHVGDDVDINEREFTTAAVFGGRPRHGCKRKEILNSKKEYCL